MYQEKYTDGSSGFTLVELAIVMIIIGLLIGGILKGQAIVDNSRTVATIRLIKTIEASALSFKDRYGALPGDAIAARVPGCTAANNCIGGDENGAVGNVLGEDGLGWRTRLEPIGMRRETYEFWKHLALAGFISGIDPGADVLNDAAWGVTHPQTPFGGGLEFVYDGWTVIGFSGHVVRISGTGIGGVGPVEGELTPNQAARIDRKLDDGNPSQGDVFADYGSNDNDCKTFDVYDESGAGVCTLFIGLFN